MKIDINWLRLINFKGAINREIAFHQNTEILGRNRSGKSTTFDAWTWLLFGKNSFDAKEFSVQPLDSEGKTTNHLNVEVEAGVTIDGSQVILKRVLSEKWVKARGAENATLSGNETSYFKNGVPMKMKDFNDYIGTILPEMIFKILSSVGYFPSLPWQTRRELLFKMAGEVTDQDIAATREDFTQLLSANTNLATLKKELAAKKKMLKEEAEKIPTRIEEAQRTKPEPVDEALINEQIDAHNRSVEQIESQIADATKAVEYSANKYAVTLNRISTIQARLNEISTTERQRLFEENAKTTAKINTVKSDIQKEQGHIDRLTTEIATNKKTIERHNTDMNRLRTKIASLNAETPDFSKVQESCPSCKQSIPEGMVETAKETIRTNFNADLKLKSDRINEDGMKMKSEVDRLGEVVKLAETNLGLHKVNLEKLNAELTALSSVTSPVTPSLDDTLKLNEEYVSLTNESLELKALPKPEPAKTEELVRNKTEIASQITALRDRLKDAERITQIEARVTELKNESNNLSQQIANVEKTELLIFEFDKAKVEATNAKINSMFRVVTFRMFNTFLNGNEDPCCDILVNGVPYESGNLNTGDRILAGIDMIETFVRFYNVYPPVFIDNAESVDSDRLIAPHGCQTIALIRSDEHQVMEVLDKTRHAAMA